MKYKGLVRVRGSVRQRENALSSPLSEEDYEEHTAAGAATGAGAGD